MATLQSPDYSPHIINGVYEVASHHVGRTLLGVIRDCFTGGKIRGGDYYLNRSRSLLRQHYALLPHGDRDIITIQFTETTTAKQRMRSAKGSIRERYSLAKDYKERAKHLFIIVETASQRAADNTLMAQISEAVIEEAPQLPPLGTASTLSNPFSDSHETSSLEDVDVSNLNQVEMTILESEAAGQATVVLELQNRDGTTQEVAGTIPLPRGSSNETDEEVDRTTLASCAVFGPSGAGGNVGQ